MVSNIHVNRMQVHPRLDGPIPLQGVRTDVAAAVSSVLQEPNGKMLLLVDPALYQPLLLNYMESPSQPFGKHLPVACHQALSHNGLTAQLIQHIPSVPNVVFIVHGSTSNAQAVAQYVHEIRRIFTAAAGRDGAAPRGSQCWWVAAYPSAGPAFHRVLSLANVATVGDVRVRELPLHYFPLDRGLLTLHRPAACRELMTDNDPGILHQTAQALLEFARQFGMPRRIQAVGGAAVRTTELFATALREHSETADAVPSQGSVVKWVVFDRQADLCTPLLSQLTLEGRLDELQNTAPAAGWLNPVRSADCDATALQVMLHASTPGWCDWRQSALAEMHRMNEAIAECQRQRQERRREIGPQETLALAHQQRSLERPLQYLQRDLLAVLKPGGSFIDQHHREMAFLEWPSQSRGVGLLPAADPFRTEDLSDLVLSGASLEMCVRWLLLHTISRGPPPERALHDSFSLLLDSAGHQHIHTLTNLQAAGLLVSAGSSPCSLQALHELFSRPKELHSWQVLQAAGEDAPPPPYNKYKPISSVLVANAVRRYMPSLAISHLQRCSKCQGGPGDPASVFGSYQVSLRNDRYEIEHQANESRLGLTHSHQTGDAESAQGARSKMLVVMLGGCTYAEMTCMRADAERAGVELVVMTTDVITGDRFVQSFMPPSVKLASADARATMAAL